MFFPACRQIVEPSLEADQQIPTGPGRNPTPRNTILHQLTRRVGAGSVSSQGPKRLGRSKVTAPFSLHLYLIGSAALLVIQRVTSPITLDILEIAHRVGCPSRCTRTGPGFRLERLPPCRLPIIAWGAPPMRLHPRFRPGVFVGRRCPVDKRAVRKAPLSLPLTAWELSTTQALSDPALAPQCPPARRRPPAQHHWLALFPGRCARDRTRSVFCATSSSGAENFPSGRGRPQVNKSPRRMLTNPTGRNLGAAAIASLVKAPARHSGRRPPPGVAEKRPVPCVAWEWPTPP